MKYPKQLANLDLSKKILLHFFSHHVTKFVQFINDAFASQFVVHRPCKIALRVGKQVHGEGTGQDALPIQREVVSYVYLFDTVFCSKQELKFT